MEIEEAKELKIGELVYFPKKTNSKGEPMKWRVNGKVTVWKTMPDRVKVPIKHGLYMNGYITEQNMDLFERNAS